MNPAQRAFIDRFLVLEAEGEQRSLSQSEREFVDDFMVLAQATLTQDDPFTNFERVVMARWEEITWRAEGALASKFAQLSDEQNEMLRALENTRSLLGPLGWSRDECSHTHVLTWALGNKGKLGHSLRTAFATLVHAPVEPRGWSVREEVTVGPGCRVDVEIVADGWRCFVEMKIDAPERTRQLDDYASHLNALCNATGAEQTLLFLTVDGRAGAVGQGAEHVSLSFKELLRAWMPIVSGNDADATYVRMWLATIAHDLYHIGAPGPASRWSFSQRSKALEFLVHPEGSYD